MNKGEYVGAVAEASGLSRADAERAVDAMIEVIKKALARGENVNLVGFGNFEVRNRAARTGRNPKTKETIQIAASKAPAFKPGKAFKDAVS